MFDRDGRLDIFESFVVDRALPKFQTPAPSSGVVGFANIVVATSNPLFASRAQQQESSPGWWQRLIEWLRETRRMPIEQFFRSVKNGVEELEVVEGRMHGYLAAIEQAKRNGQTALAEQLSENVEGVRAETQLVALKLRKYITEEQLVAFVKKSKKGLRLDWLKNFTRVVPHAVVRTKEAADARHIFDNYVVLHYDPKKKAWSETKEEMERRKDPILFGVVRGRRRLYFVGDWVDEFCDLTLDQLADALGETPTELSKAFEVEAA